MAPLRGWIMLGYFLCCGPGIVSTPARRARGLIKISVLILPYCLFNIYLLELCYYKKYLSFFLSLTAVFSPAW